MLLPYRCGQADSHRLRFVSGAGIRGAQPRPILHHLAHHIGEPECTILFTGYQARHTLGRQIIDGASAVSIDGRTHPMRARVERLHGLSAHADRSELIRWLGHLKTPPVRLFLNHGEEGAARSLADQIRSRGWSVSIPRCGESVELT